MEEMEVANSKKDAQLRLGCKLGPMKAFIGASNTETHQCFRQALIGGSELVLLDLNPWLCRIVEGKWETTPQP